MSDRNYLVHGRAYRLRRRTPHWLWVIYGTLLVGSGCGQSSFLSPSSIAVLPSLKRGESTGVERPSRSAQTVAFAPNPSDDRPSSPSDLLERAQLAFAAGEDLLGKSDPGSTAMFFKATTLAWQIVTQTPAAGDPQHDRAAALYHDGLSRLIESAQRFGQLDPQTGLSVTTAQGPVRIPIRYHAFAWQPEDFNEWNSVSEYDAERLGKKHQRSGWGVPLVVLRKRDADERFMTRALPFSATALLRPSSETSSGGLRQPAEQILEVFNPLAVTTLPKDDGSSTPLAADISAPIAWLDKNTPHLNYEAFLHPDQIHAKGQLIMLEPYQRGKIPVIFVHGLLSDPLTWSGLVNELRTYDWVNERYQIWVYGYSTGRPFLRSAADMRRECLDAFNALAGPESDPALSRTVLIGHSMGGLLSKLQVTDSETNLWESFANRPLESLQTDQEIHQYLSNLFFFRPLPFVERVVFIGTPHGGSPIAKEWEGRFASHLVSRSHDFADEYQNFLDRNRGAITPFFAKHLPTSVDMLEPQDPCLQAIRRLPIAARVRMHSVIGTGHTLPVGGPSDGVVPVDSARHADVDSELLVPAAHQHLQSHPETVQEVLRILMLHLEEPPERGQSQVNDSRREPPSRSTLAADP